MVRLRSGTKYLTAYSGKGAILPPPEDEEDPELSLDQLEERLERPKGEHSEKDKKEEQVPQQQDSIQATNTANDIIMADDSDDGPVVVRRKKRKYSPTDDYNNDNKSEPKRQKPTTHNDDLPHELESQSNNANAENLLVETKSTDKEVPEEAKATKEHMNTTLSAPGCLSPRPSSNNTLADLLFDSDTDSSSSQNESAGRKKLVPSKRPASEESSDEDEVDSHKRQKHEVTNQTSDDPTNEAIVEPNTQSTSENTIEAPAEVTAETTTQATTDVSNEPIDASSTTQHQDSENEEPKSPGFAQEYDVCDWTDPDFHVWKDLLDNATPPESSSSESDADSMVDGVDSDGKNEEEEKTKRKKKKPKRREVTEFIEGFPLKQPVGRGWAFKIAQDAGIDFGEEFQEYNDFVYDPYIEDSDDHDDNAADGDNPEGTRAEKGTFTEILYRMLDHDRQSTREQLNTRFIMKNGRMPAKHYHAITTPEEREGRMFIRLKYKVRFGHDISRIREKLAKELKMDKDDENLPMPIDPESIDVLAARKSNRTRVGKRRKMLVQALRDTMEGKGKITPEEVRAIKDTTQENWVRTADIKLGTWELNQASTDVVIRVLREQYGWKAKIPWEVRIATLAIEHWATDKRDNYFHMIPDARGSVRPVYTYMHSLKPDEMYAFLQRLSEAALSRGSNFRASQDFVNDAWNGRGQDVPQPISEGVKNFIAQYVRIVIGWRLMKQGLLREGLPESAWDQPRSGDSLTFDVEQMRDAAPTQFQTERL